MSCHSSRLPRNRFCQQKWSEIDWRFCLRRDWWMVWFYTLCLDLRLSTVFALERTASRSKDNYTLILDNWKSVFGVWIRVAMGGRNERENWTLSVGKNRSRQKRDAPCVHKSSTLIATKRHLQQAVSWLSASISRWQHLAEMESVVKQSLNHHRPPHQKKATDKKDIISPSVGHIGTAILHKLPMKNPWLLPCHIICMELVYCHLALL